MNITLLQAAAAGAKGGAAGGSGFLLMMVAIIIVMYFFMIRPQQKKQKEITKFRQSLKRGDKVVTVGGIYGTIDDVKENYLILEIGNNVKIRVDKSSVVRDISDIQQR
ncbi:MAG: preprotein translocase subunit YajC [Bacteroidales bacterium]